MKPELEWFPDKVLRIIRERGVSMSRFERETGINRQFFYRQRKNRHHRATVLAIAYALKMDADELVAGTDMETDWEVFE